MMTAASSPDPATSPTTTPSLPSGRTNTSYQSPPTVPEPVTYRAARSRPGTAGSAVGSRLRCSATAASASSCDIMECRASAARSAASCSSSASCCPNGRPLSEPTCSTPMTLPPASRGTPSRDLMPRSTRSGFRTVVWSTVVRMTGSRDAATRPAKPAPSGMRTPCRTSSSMPLAAVGDQLPGRPVQQEHGSGVGLEHLLHALDQGLEQRLLVEPGQRGVRHCLDVAQPAGGRPLGVRIVGRRERHRAKLPLLTCRN